MSIGPNDVLTTTGCDHGRELALLWAAVRAADRARRDHAKRYHISGDRCANSLGLVSNCPWADYDAACTPLGRLPNA